jgi:hypothetical protein
MRWRRAARRCAWRRFGACSTVKTSRVKKTAHAIEQERPDILSRRWAWFEGQLDLDPDRTANDDLNRSGFNGSACFTETSAA